MLAQIIIWVVGIALVVYIAGYQLFFSGAVDMIMAIGGILGSGITKELAVTAVWGFIKFSVAGVVGWLIVIATGTISAIVSDYRK